MVAPPYYCPSSQPELTEYIEHLAAELTLPFFLYNMPSHTKTVFDVETVRRAMALPNVIGMKDSSANMVYYHQLVRLLSESGIRDDFMADPFHRFREPERAQVRDRLAELGLLPATGRA